MLFLLPATKTSYCGSNLPSKRAKIIFFAYFLRYSFGGIGNFYYLCPCLFEAGIKKWGTITLLAQRQL